MSTFKVLKGPAAANIYDENNNSQLCIDWSFNSLYYRYKNNNWIIIFVDDKLVIADIINENEIENFKKLFLYIFNNLKNYSIKSDEILNKIHKII